MPLKASLDFKLSFISDGSSTTLSQNMLTGPFVALDGVGGNGVGIIGDLLNTVPSGVTDLSINNSTVGVTAALGLAGMITFTLASPVAAGEWQIIGSFEY